MQRQRQRRDRLTENHNAERPWRMGPAKERIDRSANADLYSRLLVTVPGFGAHTSPVISSSVEVIVRFPMSDSLVSYLGLAPSVRDSAGVQHHGRIMKTWTAWSGTWSLRRSHRACVGQGQQHHQVLYAYEEKEGCVKGKGGRLGKGGAHGIPDDVRGQGVFRQPPPARPPHVPVQARTSESHPGHPRRGGRQAG